VLGGARQQDRELLAAGASDRVARAALPQEHVPGTHERLVAGTVAEAVVHGLEVVEVADHDAERLVRAQRPLDLGVQLAVEREPVVQAGEGVREGGLGKALDELRDAVADSAQQPRSGKQDAHQCEPSRRHRVEGHGRQEHAQVGSGHQRQLSGGRARPEEVGRVEAEPDVEHLAGEGRLVLHGPRVNGHHHRAGRHRHMERTPWRPCREQEQQHGDRGADDRERHAAGPELRPVQQRHREQYQRLPGEDRRGDARSKACRRLRAVVYPPWGHCLT
jgi:hypothetical protein